MTRCEALEITRGIRISDDEDSLCFKAMIIFWIGANYGFDKTKTAKTTKYSEEVVETVFSNWVKNEILVDGKIIGEWDGENDWMEVILISMCGAGELVRMEDKWGTEDMKLKLFNAQTGQFDKAMENKKTLNEHLFDTLDRLSKANTPTELNLEADKAASIVSVAGKVLEVARLKLDIIQAGQSAENSFGEIDTLPSISPSDDTDGDKKKLKS